MTVARVYFVDEGSAVIEVTEGFTIIYHSNGNIQVAKWTGSQEYFFRLDR